MKEVNRNSPSSRNPNLKPISASPSGATGANEITHGIEPKRGMTHLEKLRKRKLFQRWTLGSLVLLWIIKLCGLLQKLGLRIEEKGWDKAAALFFRHEHCGFVLACFRLDYLSMLENKQKKIHEEFAKQILISRLAEFLKKVPAFHCRLKKGWSREERERLDYTDIIEVDFDEDGNMTSLATHFENPQHSFILLNDDLQYALLAEILDAYNEFRDIGDDKRHAVLAKYLFETFKKGWMPMSRFNTELNMFIERVLCGTYIHFQQLPKGSVEAEKARLATPHFEQHQHPGSGLINVCCRFGSNYREADLWFHYHHLPVDAEPMTEMLDDLKHDWGTVGPMLLPSTNSAAASPETIRLTNGISRIRGFLDFTHVLAMRKQINADFENEMAGKATLVSLLVWGLAHHDQFRKKRFLLPVETSKQKELKHNLRLILIQPGEFITENKHDGFVAFQRKLNRLVSVAREHHVESTEFIEVMALSDSRLANITQRLTPQLLNEAAGMVCFSSVKNAEVFVAPAANGHISSFIAMGGCQLPTRDGRSIGAISICGNQQHVSAQLQLLQSVVDDYQCYV